MISIQFARTTDLVLSLIVVAKAAAEVKVEVRNRDIESSANTIETIIGTSGALAPSLSRHSRPRQRLLSPLKVKMSLI